MATSEKDRLRTALDRLPDGVPDTDNGQLKVSKELPKGVTNRELYSDIVRIAWPSFVELILTQLASMKGSLAVVSPTISSDLAAQALLSSLAMMVTPYLSLYSSATSWALGRSRSHR